MDIIGSKIVMTKIQISTQVAELLNSLDDNLVVIGMSFNETDADADSLSDFAEYHIYGTDVYLQDTDGDGR